MKNFWTAVVVGLWTIFAGLPSLAESRIALVVGNGDYPNLSMLNNPPNDARLMARKLRSLSFEVIERINVNQKVMKRVNKAFGNRLEAGGKDAVGLFYYAGHGVQVGGENYMIPVDVDIQDEADVDIEAVSANAVLANMAYAGNRLNIIVMDACRNNPFRRSFRAVSRGLARMDASKGTLIAYATAPGDVAADGSGDNSPYTKALAKAMLARGLTVERVFKEVRNDVVVAIKNNQVPWEASSLTGADFYFSGDGGPKPLSGAKAPAASAFDREVVYWQSIANSGEPGDYEAYLKQFPSGTFAGLARARITSLEEQSGASQPSMEYPFDGVWDGWLRTYGGWFSAPVEASFRVVIKNGHLRGTVQMYDETRSINAMVNKSGSLSRGRAQGALQGYDLHGTVAKGLGDGAAMGWKLEYRMTRAE